jgi:hypothetical protein
LTAKKGASDFSLEIGGLGFLFQPKLMNLWHLLCTITCMDHFTCKDHFVMVNRAPLPV